MAGLYWDITLLASVGNETATNTISRQAILYSSSGLMFSAQMQKLSVREMEYTWNQFSFLCVCVHVSPLFCEDRATTRAGSISQGKPAADDSS